MKKLISLFITVALVITAIPTFAQTSANDISSEELIEAENSRELLAAVGVVPGFPASLTDGVTRADFLNCVIAALKLGLYDNARENSFYDVKATDSFCSAVNYALELGIISEGQYFRPNDTITYSEAAKMLTVALGYDINAKAKGGYPYGYIAVAESLDLSDGLTLQPGDDLNCAQGFIMIANMLESDIRLAAAIVSDNGEYSVKYQENSNILTLLYDWYPIEGVVTGNDVTHLYDSSESLSENFVIIGSGKYYCTQNPLLGSYVEGYAKAEGNRQVVKYIKTDADAVCELYSANDPVFTGSAIEYVTANGNEKKASLESMLAVVYNGKSCVDYDADDFDINVGKLVLVDSDDDSSYDVVHIYDGEILFADIVNTDTEKLVDSFKNITVDLSDEEKTAVYEDGVLGDASYITSGAVLEYYPAKGGSYAVLNILTASVTGTVTGTGSDVIYIDDTPYSYAPYFADRYMSNVTIGSSNTFVCTADGVIAAVETISGSSKKLAYAYKFKKSSGIDNKVQFKALVQDGTHAELELANRVRVNDSASLTSQELYSQYFEGSEGQLLRFALNGDGEVSSVYFPETPEATQDLSVYDPNSESKDIIKPYVIEGVADTTMIYYKIFGVFVPYFTIDNDTVIFCVDPSDKKTDEERYTIGSTSSWSNDTQLAFSSIKPYNVTSSGRAGVLVVAASQSTEISEDGALGGVIESVSKALDAYGEEALKITVCSGNSYSTLYLDKGHDSYAAATDTANKTDLAIGDFILYTKDDYNSIVSYAKHFDFSEGKLDHTSNGGRDNEKLVYFYGTLGTIESASLSLDLITASGTTKTGKVNLVMQNSYAWLVDIPNKSVRAISFGQASNYMNQGHQVLLRTRYASINELIIYKTK